MAQAKFKKDGSVEVPLDFTDFVKDEGMLLDLLKRRDEKMLLSKIEDIFVKVLKKVSSLYKVQGLSDTTIKYSEMLYDVINLYRIIKNPDIPVSEKEKMIESFKMKYSMEV